MFMVDRLEQTKALASDARLAILDWLAAPDDHFGHQVTGTASEIGVCVSLIAEKLEMAQPTASRHLEILRRANFVSASKRGTWTFFKRDEDAIRAYKSWINEHL